MRTPALLVAVFTFALVTPAIGQTRTVKLEVAGTVLTRNAALFPNANPGDSYEGVYTIEVQPGVDTNSDPTFGDFRGPASLDLRVGTQNIQISLPFQFTFRIVDNLGGINDMAQCNINDPFFTQSPYQVSLSQVDTSKSLLTSDAFPSEATLNAFPYNIFAEELRIWNNQVSPGVTALTGRHTSAHWTVSPPPADPPVCLTAEVMGIVTHADPQAYPDVLVGEIYTAVYTITYSPNQDEDFSISNGQWYGDASVKLVFPSRTIQIGTVPGVMSSFDNLSGLNDLGRLSAGDASAFVSLSFLDTAKTTLVNDDAPTEAQWNNFPVGVSPDELRVFDPLNLATPLISGRHNTATFTLVDGTCDTCLADTNGDGFLDNGDIATFITLYLSGDASADFNSDGFLDNGDIQAFVAAFLEGC